MKVTIKSISTIILVALCLTACAKFQFPESAKPVLPALIKHPPATAEISFAQGEYENKYTTYVTDARASWMIGQDKSGRKYSLIAIGRSGVVDGYQGSRSDRLKYDQFYTGFKISDHKWNVSASGNADKYRFEAELVLPVTDNFSVMPGVRHENAWDQGKKQTTLRVGGSYRFAKNLYGIVAAEIQNVGADSINDSVGGGLKIVF